MGLLQRSLLRLAAGTFALCSAICCWHQMRLTPHVAPLAGPWTVRPGAWGTATSAAAGAWQQPTFCSSSAAVRGDAVPDSSPHSAVETSQPSTSSSEAAEGAAEQLDNQPRVPAAAAARQAGFVTNRWQQWTPHGPSEGTVDKGRQQALFGLQQRGRQLSKQLRNTHDLATLQQMLQSAHQWDEPLHRGHPGTAGVITSALHACRRIANTAVQPKLVPRWWLTAAPASSSSAAAAAEGSTAAGPSTAAAVQAADGAEVPLPSTQQQQLQRRQQPKAPRPRRLDVPHLQRIMLGLADDFFQLSVHNTSLPHLHDFVQVRVARLASQQG
jgi:hypothetical protein